MNLLIKKFIKDYTLTDHPDVRIQYGKLTSWMGIFSNIILFLAKFIAGTIAGSVAITADAINNLSDAASSIISLFGFKLAARPADKEHPFGHGRYEYLSGLMVSVMILTIGIELLQGSIDKIIHPTEVHFNLPVAATLLLSVLIKLWMATSYHRIGSLIQSNTLIATAADSRNDVISTLSVLLTSMIAHFTGIALDGIMGLFVALFILYSGFHLICETLDPLLGKAPDTELVQQIQKKILSYPGVLGTHDLIVHDYGPGRQFASVHVEMAAEENVLKCHEIIDTIELDFRDNMNLHMIIHYDPIITDDPAIKDLRHWLSNEILSLDGGLSIHDLRVVPGHFHTNLIFDCVIPHNCQHTQEEVVEKIKHLVHTKYPTYRCVITIDRDFAAIPH